ncbi:uncharacterized protein BO95DRAFT_295241 [Aspergillus brunneoviolaceus CBS 621.78]|uniref:Uncharacterized protein n=1 Tax=Aspergillus brunneoviolaceus CBS 621.78 TaxID=1450534 RepID=A0ACD1FUB6_9EURO|nr:hypothetical protein BO95DRAFT_295241 [Aspergillus brunneoviolaceus CBS 621.78]RAH40603.1 hypothetical protein BO95DRAFT_295241 [Aspergillus brunneoviolaceus CBS 621.78]
MLYFSRSLYTQIQISLSLLTSMLAMSSNFHVWAVWVSCCRCRLPWSPEPVSTCIQTSGGGIMTKSKHVPTGTSSHSFHIRP